ncbi:hypothetical protein T11_13829 [Trichinella zimbabwensis]|uniref:Uncharacterized protein n=1 Tax=Trichinella zimbabwensis TaxID=268475 RepID=A0A0V1HCA1_9BILA|nr:hypothetical protein T11_13829 [Trichinella zimbabwensis]
MVFVIKYSRPSTFAVCAFRQNRKCQISANTCRFCSYNLPMPYNPTQLPESCKGYHGPSTNLSPSKAEVWGCPDMSGLVDQSGSSVWNRGTGAAVDQLPRLFSLPVWLSRYHYSYGVEPHKRKRPCTEPADPQHTYTLGSKNRIYLFGGFEIREC